MSGFYKRGSQSPLSMEPLAEQNNNNIRSMNQTKFSFASMKRNSAVTIMNQSHYQTAA